jgi:hypothetical protein
MADQQYLDLLNNAIGGDTSQGRTPEETAMLWSAFGSSLQGGTPFFEAVRGMRQQRQQDALNKIKLLEMRQKLQQQQQVGDILSGAGEQSPAQAALAAGAAQTGQVGPTLAAGQAFGAQPAMSPARIQAERYRKAAAALAATSPDSADKYLAMADRLDPTPEYSQPVVEQGPAGKPILVQYDKRGGRRVVEGALPKRELQTLNLGGMSQIVDTNEIVPGTTFRHSMTPGEAANLDVARQRLALDQYDIKETPEGLVYVPKAPGVQARAFPVMGAGGQPVQSASSGKFTEDERKSAGFSLRMTEANKILSGPATDDQGKPILGDDGKPLTLEQLAGKPGFAEAAVGLVPFAGGAMERGAARSAGKYRLLYRQGQENWVTANMRAESGAVIGDVEMERDIRKFFPQYGDPPEVIAQKADARRQAEAAMQARAGGALKGVSAAYGGMAGARNAPVAPQLQNVPGASIPMWDPKTRTFK